MCRGHFDDFPPEHESHDGPWKLMWWKMIVGAEKRGLELMLFQLSIEGKREKGIKSGGNCVSDIN
jgi:hypothetical protein